MSIPAGYSRVVVNGSLKSGAEIFEWGFWLHAAPTSDADANTLAQQIATLISTDAISDLTDLIEPTDTYDGVKVYSYPAGGPRAAHVGVYNYVTPWPGSGTGKLPLQCCMVVTTLTGNAGRRNRGRVYLPATGLVLAAEGLYAGNDVDHGVGAIGALFTAIHGTLDDVVVLSQVAGSANRITSVRGDNKPDIQRRRANALTANYTKTVSGI